MPGSYLPKSSSIKAFEDAGIDGTHPILFKGAALSWPVMSKWNLKHIKKEFGPNTIKVLYTDDTANGYIVGFQKMF